MHEITKHKKGLQVDSLIQEGRGISIQESIYQFYHVPQFILPQNISHLSGQNIMLKVAYKINKKH